MAWMVSLAASGQTEGIFADFTTSMGNFTVWLDASNAPRAVASFVGLATGTTGWLDEQSNVWHRPFYDESIFYRVVKDPSTTNGIAIQGGGMPTAALSSTDRLMTVATNSYEGQSIVNNASGISTNVLNLPVVTSNAPAVATNYMLNGVTFETNAPMIATVRIEAVVVSSNSWGGGLTNQGSKTVVLTNFSLIVQTTTNIVQMNVVITNGSGTNGTTIHSVAVQAGESNVVRAPIVLTNFVNAGYTMLENLTNGLTHSNGVISMANSGPNTDGSQFFITATNMPGWNGGYTVFGHVTTGMNVVTSIAAVAVQGDKERPVADIVLDRVAIRRVGAAAEAFDVAAQGIPSPESTPMRVDRNGSNLDIQIEVATQTKPLKLSESSTLLEWSHGPFPVSVGLAYTGMTYVLAGAIPLASMGDKYFFHASRIRYPVPITAPTNHRGRVYTFVWNTVPTVTNESHFGPNAVTPGMSYEWAGTNAVVTSQLLSGWESWTRDTYSADLVSLDSRIYYYYYSLGFNPGATTNRFTCRRVDGGSGATSLFSGTFTVR